MGQQQLLLIILSVIVLGIAVAVGITMFSDSSINVNRDALTNDLAALASRAHQYFRRPSYLTGGGNSFAGLTYSIVIAGSGFGPAATVEILGVGTEQFAGAAVSARVRVYPDRDSVWIVN